jgi:hypothetical protein
LFGGAPFRAESLASQVPPDASPADRAQAEHLRVQARLATGRGVAEAPALLLDAALSCTEEAPGMAREILREAVTATFSAGQLMTAITPAELGRRILTALGDDPAERTPEDLLLAGLATLLSGRYLAAAPLLREAIAALAAAPAPRERVPASWPVFPRRASSRSAVTGSRCAARSRTAVRSRPRAASVT